MKKIIAIILVLASLFTLVACAKKIEWPESEMGKMIPQIKKAKGEVYIGNLNSIQITVEDINENGYLKYIEACKEKGFTIDAKEEYSFTAFNDRGYKIYVTHSSSSDEMRIEISEPMEMTEFEWPQSEIAKLIPTPKSNVGKLHWENENGFIIEVGNFTKAEFDEYVDEFIALGFTEDSYKKEEVYYADNSDGYGVYIKYEGFNTVYIKMEAPKEEQEESKDEGNTESDNESTEEDENVSSGELDNGMRPEFKEALDSYEEFINDYCDFMKRYSTSGNSLSMLGDYLKFVAQYAEMVDKIDKIGNEEMNDAELIYYTEVMMRVTQKLSEIA